MLTWVQIKEKNSVFGVMELTVCSVLMVVSHEFSYLRCMLRKYPIGLGIQPASLEGFVFNY